MEHEFTCMKLKANELLFLLFIDIGGISKALFSNYKCLLQKDTMLSLPFIILYMEAMSA